MLRETEPITRLDRATKGPNGEIRTRVLTAQGLTYLENIGINPFNSKFWTRRRTVYETHERWTDEHSQSGKARLFESGKSFAFGKISPRKYLLFGTQNLILDKSFKSGLN